MNKSPNFALVAGGGGVVGAGIVRKLASYGWKVGAISRTPLDIPGVQWISADLSDPDECRQKFRDFSEVTHVFCAARFKFKEGGREPLDENLAIVRNLVETIDEISPNLRHVHLVQGSKFYGSHVGPVVTPIKEHYPRSLVSNFYYLQQDYIVEKQATARWSWSASRPDALIGGQRGISRNLVSVIGAYALICRELGQPFSFPGKITAYDALYQCTSIDHLAEGIVWMSESPDAANNAFNLVNGDYFRWSTLWSTIARYFDMPLGPARPMKLSEAMADKGPIWKHICEEQDIPYVPLEAFAAWDYADYILSRDWDVMSDMTKARKAGFVRAVDTEKEFLRFFSELGLRGTEIQAGEACR